MTAPIALQLYTVRELIAERGFEPVVREVAEIGYAGVEPAGFPGTTPEQAGQLFRELGLQVPSAHMPLPVGDDVQTVVETMTAIGSRYIISGRGPEQFKDPKAIAETCALFNQAAANARAHGLRFGIHNHWWEYLKVGDRYAYEHMLDLLDPDVIFEIDTYWVKTAGADPVAVVRKLGARAPLLHIKDGPATRDAPMTAIGSGVMDFPAIVQAAGEHLEWMIVELDRCATDMMEAVRQSYDYLVGEGLAHGNR